jgi:hypothetical protein
MERFKAGDWVAYNWLDDEGNDNWKIGRIVQTETGLMYFNDDGTERSGYMPITNGVKLIDAKVKFPMNMTIWKKANSMNYVEFCRWFNPIKAKCNIN